MSDILTKIEAYKRDEIAAAKSAHPLSEVEARAASAQHPPATADRRVLGEEPAPAVDAGTP